MIDTDKVREEVMAYLYENPMSVRRLADEVGVQDHTLRDFLSGKRSPQMHTLIKILNHIRED